MDWKFFKRPHSETNLRSNVHVSNRFILGKLISFCFLFVLFQEARFWIRTFATFLTPNTNFTTLQVLNYVFQTVPNFELKTEQRVRFRNKFSEACQFLERFLYLKKAGLKLIDLLRKKEDVLRYWSVFQNMLLKYIFYSASVCEWESFNIVAFRKMFAVNIWRFHLFYLRKNDFFGFFCLFRQHVCNWNLYNACELKFKLRTLLSSRLWMKFSKMRETLK